MWRVTSGSSEPVCSASFTKTSLFSYEFIVSSGEVSVVLKYLHLNHILCSLVQGLLFIINVNADSAASRSPSQLQQGKNSFCSQLITNMQFNGWSIHLLLPHYTINEPSLFYWTHTQTRQGVIINIYLLITFLCQPHLINLFIQFWCRSMFLFLPQDVTIWLIRPVKVVCR